MYLILIGTNVYYVMLVYSCTVDSRYLEPFKENLKKVQVIGSSKQIVPCPSASARQGKQVAEIRGKTSFLLYSAHFNHI